MTCVLLLAKIRIFFPLFFRRTDYKFNNLKRQWTVWTHFWLKEMRSNVIVFLFLLVRCHRSIYFQFECALISHMSLGWTCYDDSLFHRFVVIHWTETTYCLHNFRNKRRYGISLAKKVFLMHKIKTNQLYGSLPKKCLNQNK